MNKRSNHDTQSIRGTRSSLAVEHEPHKKAWMVKTKGFCLEIERNNNIFPSALIPRWLSYENHLTCYMQSSASIIALCELSASIHISPSISSQSV